MTGDWQRYQEFVLRELKRLNNNIEKMETKLDCISKDTAVLKVKAGLWGLIGGAIPVVVGLALYFFQKIM